MQLTRRRLEVPTGTSKADTFQFSFQRISANPLTLLRSISLITASAQQAYPGSSSFERLRRLRFFCRSLLWWRPTVSWLGLCTQPPLAHLARHCPTMLERMHRPFLHGSFTAEQAFIVSAQHQAFTRTSIPGVVNSLAAGHGHRIAKFEVESENWHVLIESLDRFQKEGDWTLSIRDIGGWRLVSCTFSLAHIGGWICRPRLLIGCVQGPDRSAGGQDLFRSLTRKWHGLRPKDLIVYLAQSLAFALEIRNVMIVCHEAHIYSSWRYRFGRNRIAADYGALSNQRDKRKVWKGWFVLGKPQRPHEATFRQTTGARTRRERRESLKASLHVQIGSAVARAREANCAQMKGRPCRHRRYPRR
ncbi:DUF535 family protein [Paraburkholderia sp. DD10]|uniref:DUF535 family protein n=1 Tax=Paraburkholderia TaxID=1822464 RepID=UPI001FD36A19|nr:DUF535 family protein [Paraburkholderia terricola]